LIACNDTRSTQIKDFEHVKHRAIFDIGSGVL
jgi:hypothetical protein